MSDDFFLPDSNDVKAIVDWFHINYELCPKPETTRHLSIGETSPGETSPKPSLRIYTAREVITEVFGEFANNFSIEQAIRKIENYGHRHWTRAEKNDPEDFEIAVTPSSLRYIPDALGPAYGSDEDNAVRERVRAALNELSAAIETSAAVGLGHNRPPESIDENWPELVLPAIVQSLHDEFGKSEPSISIVKQLAHRLGTFSVQAARWSGKKLDIMADEVAKTAGKGLIVGTGIAIADERLRSALGRAFETIVHWLQLVAAAF